MYESIHHLLIITIVSGCLVEPADLNYMTSAIRGHFSNTRHHDPEYMSYKNRAKEYIYNEFVRFGLETEYDTFDEPRLSSTVRCN